MQTASTILRLGRLRALQLSKASSSCWALGSSTTVVRAFAEEAAKAAPSPPPPPPASGGLLSSPIFYGVCAGLVGSAAYFYNQQQIEQQSAGVEPSASTPTAPAEVKKDYKAVRTAIANILDVEGYDDGSYGPLLVRLAWHAAGTYDQKTNTGGSNGATMRFAPESEWGANNGLKIARDLLEPIKQKFPWISYADLWTLAGCVAIEEMGGPSIPWRAGRVDKLAEDNACPPAGRLPDADKGTTGRTAQHVRDIFYRMGFDDREITALLGAHTLGRCHADRSGYVNPWTNAPTTFSNLYYVELTNNKWRKKNWKGPVQYEDPTGQLMMLPADMVMLWDKGFKKYVTAYAKDEELFFKDFSAAFAKLMELGVPFAPEAQAV